MDATGSYTVCKITPKGLDRPFFNLYNIGMALTFRTKEEAAAFIRRVMGPPKRTLEGKEREDILLLLSMIEPYSTSNNQHSWTDCYMIGSTDYHITTFPGGDVIVDLILPEDDE